MKNYVKPVVLENEEIFEGVYAASGLLSSECWQPSVVMDQADAGGYSTYRVSASHSGTVEHISSQTTITIIFAGNVTGAEFEGFDASISGSTVILTRQSHANAYKSGDQFNTLLKIWPAGLGVLDYGIECKHEENVQGKYD